MEAPPEISGSRAGPALSKIAQGPGPAVQRLLEQNKPSTTAPLPEKPTLSRQARLRWSLLAADLILILLCASLLNGLPLMAVFWKEWVLAIGALGFGGWLAWLSLTA